jgi:hypothetical protein
MRVTDIEQLRASACKCYAVTQAQFPYMRVEEQSLSQPAE